MRRTVLPGSGLWRTRRGRWLSSFATASGSSGECELGSAPLEVDPSAHDSCSRSNLLPRPRGTVHCRKYTATPSAAVSGCPPPLTSHISSSAYRGSCRREGSVRHPPIRLRVRRQTWKAHTGRAPYLDCAAAPNIPTVTTARSSPWLSQVESEAASWIISDQLAEYSRSFSRRSRPRA